MAGPMIDEELRQLREDINRLLQITESLIKNVSFDRRKDHMGFMALCFVSKQIDHVESICLLEDNNKYRDAWLLSRIMFEGLAFLYWASQDPVNRPYNWKSYYWVEEFKRSYGKSIDQSHKTEIEDGLKAYCTQFLKKKSIDKDIAQIIPDDYYNRWYISRKNSPPVRINDIIKSVNLGLLEKPVYSMTSGWIHWDSFTIGQVLQFDGSCFSYSNETKWIGILAFETGYMSLLLSDALLDSHFKLDSPKLQEELKHSLAKAAEP